MAMFPNAQSQRRHVVQKPYENAEGGTRRVLMIMSGAVYNGGRTQELVASTYGIRNSLIQEKNTLLCTSGIPVPCAQ